jgi:bacterioferritin-associated ferredoxin
MICGTNGDSSPFICRLTADTPDYAANARLIAAAPELLEHLRQMTDLAERYGVGEDCDGNIIAARAAIAKAEAAR